mgnify:CR=1 FL=1
MKLFYRAIGEKGPTIIILHGIFGTSDNWLGIGKALAENHRVFLVDQRNHGQSPWDDAFDYQVMSADLFEFIQDHALDSPILIGHSMGEVSAAVAAGVLTAAEGLQVIAARSQLMAQLTDKGAVALLELGAPAAEALIDPYPGVAVTVYSSPRQTVVAGPADGRQRERDRRAHDRALVHAARHRRSSAGG